MSLQMTTPHNHNDPYSWRCICLFVFIFALVRRSVCQVHAVYRFPIGIFVLILMKCQIVLATTSRDHLPASACVMSHTTTTMLAFALACVAFTAAAPARDRRQGHRGRPFSENDLPAGSHLRRELARCGSRGVSVCQSFPTVFPRGLVAFACRACVARVIVPCGLKRPMACFWPACECSGDNR